MLAIVRKRRAVIREVKPFGGENGVLHLVRLDYKDEYQPESKEVLSELEPARQLLKPNDGAVLRFEADGICGARTDRSTFGRNMHVERPQEVNAVQPC